MAGTEAGQYSADMPSGEGEDSRARLNMGRDQIGEGETEAERTGETTEIGGHLGGDMGT